MVLSGCFGRFPFGFCGVWVFEEAAAFFFLPIISLHVWVMREATVGMHSVFFFLFLGVAKVEVDLKNKGKIGEERK